MQSKTIFITGCSSGIGHDAALALTHRGHKVIAACRKSDDVQKLIDLGLKAVQMDMDDTLSIDAAFNAMLEMSEGHLDVLINNAGYGQAGALEDLDRATLRRQFETNVFGLMDLTRLAIPIMRRQGQGRIINVSSVLGIISMPFRGAYNASKYAVEGLSDTLRLELHTSGIFVICVEPGPIASRFRDSSVDSVLQNVNVENSYFKAQYQRMLGVYRQSKNKSVFTCQPDAVIKKFIHAIESDHPKAKYPVTFPAHLFSVLKRVLSVRMLDWVLRSVSRKELG
ncbi:MAG: SDR family NAD(P)-dependent oxidoreductase [Gammaproteobacteria bacterium]|nr:SDR family NAD(P)-dependent oxidoreductase [Gammaproteobacteria bacterium]